MMNRYRGTLGMVVVGLALATTPACTLFLNHDATQCKSDSDCKHFGAHPYCDSATHLCVSSGYAPNDCIFWTPDNPPRAQTDFLNQCTQHFPLSSPADPDAGVGACLSFNRPFDADAGITPPPGPTQPAMAPPPAVTTVHCTELAPAEKIVYFSGSSNFPPLLQELAPFTVKTSGIFPVFRNTTSCSGVKSMNMTSPTTYGPDHTIKDPPAIPGINDTYAQIFLGDGNPPVNCLLGSNGAPVDVGEAEIAPETCGPPANDPTIVGEELGPILPIVFAVPAFSTERAISFKTAQQVFGGGGGVPPWEDPSFIFIRGNGTATLRLVALELELMPTQVWGGDQGNAQGMIRTLSGIQTYKEAAEAIGIVGSDFYDQGQNRTAVKALAFQAKDQECAFLPDSSLTSRDKINVRDGHYPLWGRIHFFMARGPGGGYVKPNAADFVFLMTTPSPDKDTLSALIKAGFVPPCAMKVKRTAELGDFTPFDPPPSACGCYFDSYVGAPARPECATCMTDLDCTNNIVNNPATADPLRIVCHYGFCEQPSN